MKQLRIDLGVALALVLGTMATLVLLWVLGSGFSAIEAQGPDETDTYYVAPGGLCGTGISPCYATVQAAVDAVDDPGDVIKVAAGSYTDIHFRNGITQVVYITKTVTIVGGYTTTNWIAPDPRANPTTLDAQDQGRVLYIAGSISPTVEGLSITGGNAVELGGDPLGYVGVGGGVCAFTATVTLSNNLVFSNAAQYGGGLALWYGDATISGNSITSNTASLNGGGLSLDLGAAVLHHNTFAANAASNGGGLSMSWSTVSLAGNVVISNTAEWYGGGVDLFIVYSGSASFSSDVFSLNAAEYGGGLFLRGSDIALSGSKITGNTAGERGGGLYLSDGSGTALVNNVVADNYADVFGSGLYIQDASCRALHTTVVRNRGGDGSGIHVTRVAGPDSTLFLTNTILVSHTVGITVATGNTATMEATLWGSGSWANGTDWNGLTVITGTVNVWGDPGFVGPDAGDYHIAVGSAAVDAGVDAAITSDIDGQTRPSGDGFDLGADEFWFTVYLAKVLRHAP